MGMKKLRLLQLDHVDLTGDYRCLSKDLRWVHWQGFTFNYTPDDFYQENLVVIDLKYSSIQQVWNETKVYIFFSKSKLMTVIFVSTIFFSNFYFQFLSSCSCWIN